MELSEFEVGCAIKYCKKNESSKFRKFKSNYGLVVGVSDIDVSFFVVSRIRKRLPNGVGTYRILCYDDVDAVYEKHKDNVRLRKCPPPFVELSDGIKENVYVNADFNDVSRFTVDNLTEYDIVILGKVDDDVIDEIKNHPFSTQSQKEFTHHGYRQGSDKVADISKDDDTQFGD